MSFENQYEITATDFLCAAQIEAILFEQTLQLYDAAQKYRMTQE